MPRHLVILSGNVAVGKSTLGPYLARQLQAEWISESDLSSQFPFLLSDETRQSRLISQIAFPTLRVATVLSAFLGGAERIVAERSLEDNWLFHEVWREHYGLSREDSFFKKLYRHLDDLPLEYDEYIVRLTCRLDVLKARISKRCEPFDHVNTEHLLKSLEAKYEVAFQEHRHSFARSYDVSDLEYSDESLQRLAQKIASDLPELT